THNSFQCILFIIDIFSPLQLARAGSSPLVALGEIEFCAPPHTHNTPFTFTCIQAYCIAKQAVFNIISEMIMNVVELLENKLLYLKHANMFRSEEHTSEPPGTLES